MQLNRKSKWFCSSAMVLLLTIVVSAVDIHAAADEKQIVPATQWQGNISVEQAKAEPADSIVTDQKTFRKLLAAWGIKEHNLDKKQKWIIDHFDEYVAVTALGPGSHTNLVRLKVVAGDLKADFAMTLDLIKPAQYSYVIAIVPRAGVKSFNKKPIPRRGRSLTPE